VISFGLSGTARLGRSGTQSSDDREPKWPLNPQKRCRSRALNLANKESFGFLLTSARPWTDGETPPLRPAETRADDEPPLTHVKLFWRKGKHEDWLKFGKPVADRIVSRSQRIESYSPDQLFGLVRWASNEYGTIRSSLDIVRAVQAGEPVTPVQQVDPGGEVLLSVHGWPKVAQVFRRMAAREAPRRYTAERHRAWLQRKALLS
jgi:hypothetical protein